MVTPFVDLVDLLMHLRERRAPHQVDMDARSIEMPCSALPVADVTYVRWEKRLPYLQIIQPVVRNVPAARSAEVWSAMCRINDSEPLGSFSLEPARRFIYLRRTLAVYEDGILATWFDRELAAVLELAGRMYAPLKAVVDGQPSAT